ncbi:MAG: hypothetical protein U0T02_08510 [Solirubrobacteraceae bacterium]
MTWRPLPPLALAAVAAVAALAAPAAAVAAPAPDGALQPLTPFAGARAAAGTTLTFRVRVPRGTALPVAIVIASSPRTAGGALRGAARITSGEARTGALDPFIAEWRPAGRAARALGRQGRYWWQAEARTAGGGSLLRSAPRALVIAAPPRDAGAIPSWIGRRGRSAFRVSLRGIPETVGATRFLALAVRSGRRWGLRPVGTTGRRAGVRDGVDAVGFSSAVPPRALGVTTVYRIARYRVARRCGPGGCVVVGRPRLVGTRIVERDVALDPSAPWQRGPARPSSDQFDLETALLHELGHAAGNRRHAHRCADSPLIPALSPGDWWRSPTDHSFRACGEASIAEAPPRFAVRDVVVARSYVYVPAAGARG